MKYKFYINKRLHDVDPIIANYPLSKYYFNNVFILSLGQKSLKNSTKINY